MIDVPTPYKRAMQNEVAMLEDVNRRLRAELDAERARARELAGDLDRERERALRVELPADDTIPPIALKPTIEGGRGLDAAERFREYIAAAPETEVPVLASDAKPFVQRDTVVVEGPLPEFPEGLRQAIEDGTVTFSPGAIPDMPLPCGECQEATCECAAEVELKQACINGLGRDLRDIRAALACQPGHELEAIAALQSRDVAPDFWRHEAADALGEVRTSDGAPRDLEWARILECIRDLRAARDEYTDAFKAIAKSIGSASSYTSHVIEAIAALVAAKDAYRREADDARHACDTHKALERTATERAQGDVAFERGVLAEAIEAAIARAEAAEAVIAHLRMHVVGVRPLTHDDLDGKEG